jgi:hypothetical protein
MKKSKIVGIGVGLVMLASIVFAAENAVQMTVQELRVGKDAIKVSGDSDQMLEKLNAGTYVQPTIQGSVVSLKIVPGAVLTNSAAVMYAHTHSSATCTLANVTVPGQVAYLLHNKLGSTGTITIATGGNFAGPSLSLATGDMATLVAAGTNWFAVGQ